MSNKKILIDNLPKVIDLIDKDLSEQGQKDINKIKEKLNDVKKKSKKLK